jgi:hypothetical protein
MREGGGRRVLVVCNFAPFGRPLPAQAAGARVLLSTHAEPDPGALAGDEARVLALASAG